MLIAFSFITVLIIKRKVLKLNGKRPIRRPKVWEEGVINTNLRVIYYEHITVDPRKLNTICFKSRFNFQFV